MDRQLVGILLIAACLVALVVGILWIRHNAPRRVYRRQRLADEARWAARAARARQPNQPAD